MAICLVGLGSNLGDRIANLLRSVAALHATAGVNVLRVSSLWETAPVGGPVDQPPFLNGAALIETSLAPREMLSTLLSVENILGRVRDQPWGPRTIDLDLLLFDKLIVESSELTLPHPRLAERRFVLQPAAELDCPLRHPASGKSIVEMLAELPPEKPGEMRMRVITSARQMQQVALASRHAGRRIGFVPTMGALHVGHLSLVQRAREACDVAVASIFVNPTQFGPREDFGKYPRTLEADLQALSAAKCDVVFVPDQSEIYPPGCTTLVEPPAVAQPLEGAFRPGHFRGVATVVLKLFNLVQPHRAYFGQKDYQQQLVIRHMTADLNLPVEIVTCPTVRESDGLALSSRNRYLSASEREQALALSRALTAAELLVAEGITDAATIVGRMKSVLGDAGIERIDYVALADVHTLAEVLEFRGEAVALIACHVGGTRLIDNRVMQSSPPSA
ncbi:MAG: pantoate--beta-alanine ligase [Pirellulaceae bacterium]|nr:pantoate--beta-alanine ligase [Pirellulaceae bacterium]